MYKKSLIGGTDEPVSTEQNYRGLFKTRLKNAKEKAKNFYQQNIKVDIRELTDDELKAMIKLDQKYLQEYKGFYGKEITLNDYTNNKEKYEAIRNRLQNFILKKKQKKAKGCYSNAGYPVCNTAPTPEECNGKKDNVGHNCIWIDGDDFDPDNYQNQNLVYKAKDKVIGMVQKGIDITKRDNFELGTAGRMAHTLVPIAGAALPGGTLAAIPAAKMVKTGVDLLNKTVNKLKMDGRDNSTDTNETGTIGEQ